MFSFGKLVLEDRYVQLLQLPVQQLVRAKQGSSLGQPFLLVDFWVVLRVSRQVFMRQQLITRWDTRWACMLLPQQCLVALEVYPVQSLVD
jgi:hypothetical protein